MADIAITAANVVAQSGSVQADGTAGAAIAAGEILYKDAADSNKLKLADNDTTTKATVVGIALNSAATGQPVTYAKSGTLTMATASTFTKAIPYILSTTAGKMCPIGDTAASTYMTVIGVALSTSELKVSTIVSGVTP